MVILLTGASGFLGRLVMKKLLGRGHKVWALSRRTIDGKSQDLTEITWDMTAELPVGKIPWQELGAIIHLAASGVKSAHRDWADALRVNVGATMQLLTAAQRNAPQKPRVVVTRTFYEHLVRQAPALRGNPYIATKAMASELAKEWSEDQHWPVTMATVFQLYGPGDDSSSVLSYAARQFATRQPALFGSGLGCRDWLFVDDAADAIVSLLECRESGLSEWDVGSGQLTSIRHMVEALAAIPHSGAGELNFDPARDRPDVDLKLVATRFPPGWRPKVSPAEGLRQLLAATSTGN